MGGRLEGWMHPKSGLPDFGTKIAEIGNSRFRLLAAILRDAPQRCGAPSTKVKTKFPLGSTMENRLSSAVVGPAGGQLRTRLMDDVDMTRTMETLD